MSFSLNPVEVCLIEQLLSVKGAAVLSDTLYGFTSRIFKKQTINAQHMKRTSSIIRELGLILIDPGHEDKEAEPLITVTRHGKGLITLKSKKPLLRTALLLAEKGIAK